MYNRSNNINNINKQINITARMDPGVNIQNKIPSYYGGKIMVYKLEALIYKASTT